MDKSISKIKEESVEVVTTVFKERICERICEQGGPIEVSKISSQGGLLQRTERVHQRTAKQIDDAPQFLDEVVEKGR